MDDRKRALRRSLLAARAAADPGVRAQGDAARTDLLVDALAGVACLTCYVSTGAEPDTSGLIGRLAAAGVRVLLPRQLPAGGLELADAGPLRTGPHGIAEPTGPAVDRALAEVWLVPALAADRAGTRLGRGGGAYDRVLPADRPAVALLHDGELLDALPAEPHDRPIGRAALPDALLRLALG